MHLQWPINVQILNAVDWKALQELVIFYFIKQKHFVRNKICLVLTGKIRKYVRMSCQHKLFSRILALTEKSFCLTGNPIKTLLTIVVKEGVKLQILVKKNLNII